MKQPWQKTEQKNAKQLGSKLVPRSGGFWSNKGDHRDEYFNYDSKDTKHKSFKLSSEIWKKVYNDALKHNRMPALVVNLGTGEELVTLSLADFVYIRDEFIKQLEINNQ